jgi:hypothetical protein
MNSLTIHSRLKNEKPKSPRLGQYYLNTAVTPELYKEFKEYINKHHISQSKLIRTLIINYLADLEAKEQN